MQKFLVVLGLVAAIMFLIGRGEFLCAEQAQKPVEWQNWTSPATGMEFVWIEALDMWVGKYETTNAEYRMKEPEHDSREYRGQTLNRDRQPVVFVSFDDAKAYAGWMTERDRGVLPSGYRYRLPSEDEWTKFARCGDGREFPWGDNWPPDSGEAGNYGEAPWEKAFPSLKLLSGYDDGFAVSAPVDELWVNPWGLAGVGGNVWEVCAGDFVGASFGSWRGASWSTYDQERLRCSYRNPIVSSYRSRYYGFRLVLSR